MDIMSLYRAMQGDNKVDNPITFYRAYKFNPIVAQNTITAAYKNIGVEGNFLYIQSDFPVDLIIGDSSREIINVKRHMFTTDINTIQIKKSPIIFNDATTRIGTPANVGGRCRIWGFNAPYSIQQTMTQIKSVTNNKRTSNTIPALATSRDILITMENSAVSQITIHTLTIKRSIANVNSIKIIDENVTSWEYYYREPPPFLLFSERIYPIHLPTAFLIRLDVVSDAAITDIDIDITYESN